MDENKKNLERVVLDLAGSLGAQSANAYSLALELKPMLEGIKDAGTFIDSGAGLGGADLWVRVQGVEYFIHIEPSRPSAA